MSKTLPHEKETVVKELSVGASSVNRGNTTHGMYKSSEFISWQKMKERVSNPKSKSYKNYGARGITICDAWVNSFENFYRDLGAKPSPNYSIERIDCNGNYEPSNCRWATYKEQCRNTRRTRYVTFRGETRCLAEWAELLSIPYDKIRHRINRGWDINLILGEKSCQ
jgi:hypothetical protein